jgi:DNA primase
MQYPLSIEQFKAAGVTYDSYTGRACLPVYNDLGSLVYQQLRALTTDEKIKYLNVDYRATNCQDTKPIAHFGCSLHNSCVLTEDIISAISIRYAGYNAISLLGTSLSMQRALEVLRNYDRIYIWLDGDKAGTDAALKLIKMLGSLTTVTVINTSKDPKHYTTDEIELIIGEHT